MSNFADSSSVVLTPDSSHRYSPDVLVFAMLLVLVMIGSWSFSLLHETVSFDQHAFSTESFLANFARFQVNEDMSLRSYIDTKHLVALQPYREASSQIDQAFSQLRTETGTLNLPTASFLLLALRDDHERWQSLVANPILSGSTSSLRLSSIEKKSIQLLTDFRYRSFLFRNALALRISQNATAVQQQFLILSFLGGFAILFGVIAIIVTNRRQVDLSSRLARQVSTVMTLQRAFANRNESLPKTSIASVYLSASREAAVGGDLFDVRRLDDSRGYILIADVSGKGVDAAVDTALIKYTTNALLHGTSFDDPAGILSGVNDIFLKTTDNDESFVVMFLGIFDFTNFSFRYASAGHSPAFLRRGSDISQLRVTGPAIGLPVLKSTFTNEDISLLPGDLLFLATDGLTEARNSSGTFLGDEGVLSWLKIVRQNDPQLVVDEFLMRLHLYTSDNIRDDLAILAISFLDLPVNDHIANTETLRSTALSVVEK